MRLKSWIAMLTAAVCMSGPSVRAATPVTPDASPEARAVLNYLYEMKGKKILSGQMYAPWGKDEIKIVHDLSGKYPAIRGQDMIHERLNDQEIAQAKAWYEAGGIPTIMWHWGAPTLGDGFEQSKGTIDIDRCFQVGTAEHAAMWSDLKRVADHLQVLRDAHVPVLWRPMHELDGNWFWWSKGGPERYKKLWHTMFDYMARERKLNNLIWVACHCGKPKAEWSPGAGYMDLGGPDTYGKGIQEGLYKSAVAIYGNDMPIPYHECGTIPDPDECMAKGVNWSWWMLWHTGHLDRHDKPALIKAYNSDIVITRDELPNFRELAKAMGPATKPAKHESPEAILPEKAKN